MFKIQWITKIFKIFEIMEEWQNLIEAIFNDNVEKLSSLVPSQIPFNSVIPLNLEPKFKFILMNETHSLLTFASKSNAKECVISKRWFRY